MAMNETLAVEVRKGIESGPQHVPNFRRLERSLALLTSTRLSLVDVALASGFTDQSHFSRAFTGCFGLPPGEYRMLVTAHNPAHRLQMDKTGLSHWATLTARAAAARANARRGR